MRKSLIMAVGTVFTLSACDNGKKPTAVNFTIAINSYLDSHGQLCAPVGSQFPIDIPLSQLDNSKALGNKLSALQHAGLVNETDTDAVIPSLANSLSLGPNKAVQVRRYTVSVEGQKYLKSVITDFGPTLGFCYGVKQVDSIVKWSPPVAVGSSTETQVAYTYKIINIAPWASRADLQQAIPVIETTLNSTSSTTQLAVLALGQNGWQVR